MLGIVAFGLLAVVLLLVPFLDPPKSPDATPGRLWTWLAFAALAYIISFTYLGYTFNPTT